MFTKKTILLSLLVLPIAYFIFSPAKTSHIVTIINGLVFVENPPSSDQQKIKWWNDNKKLLHDKYHLIHGNDYFTIPVMDSGSGYEEIPATDFISGGSSDDYICDELMNVKKRCIKKNTRFTVMGSLKKGVFISIEDRMYKQDPYDGQKFNLE